MAIESMPPASNRSVISVVASLLLVLLTASHASAADEIPFEAEDGQEFNIVRFASEGDYLVLWLAPEYGFREAHRALAGQMSAEGIEVWQIDLVEDLFLPPGTASLKQLDGSYVADLITHAHRETGKQIVVAGDSYAATLALRGARQWQSQSPTAPYLVGAVLFTPYSYAYLPPLGLEPTYLPIVEATNIPLVVFQAERSATYTEFETLLQKLRRHDSPVYTRKLTDVMSLFYEDPPTAAMLRGAEPLARNLRQLLPLLAQHDYPLEPAPLATPAATKSGIDIYLREFRGNARPGPIRLRDISGKTIARENFAGRVTLVNFWATWCPPCIEEIPSLNRLKRNLEGRPFELLSINYAEDSATVSEFLQRIQVDFPVLLDSNGDYAKTWNVISFPSTFVIDKTGHIRYGVNAAIDWDDPELLQRLEDLMHEKSQ